MSDHFSVDHEEGAGHSGGEHGGEELWLVSYADMMTLLCGFFLILLSFSKVDDNKFEKMKEAASKVFGGEYQKPFAELSKSVRQVIDRLGLGDQVTINENEKGVELSFRGGFFFESASTQLRLPATELLSVLVPELKKSENEFHFKIEGHTDSLPVRMKEIPSNWELSSVRACTVLRIFEAAGFPKSRLKAVGYADTQPVACAYRHL